MSELLKQKSMDICAKLQRFGKFLENMDEKSFEEIELRLNDIKELKQKFESVHEKLKEIGESDENEMELFEEKYYENISLATQNLNRRNSELSVSPLRFHSTTMESSARRERSVKLPKISLPKFDGDISNWPSFRDRYESLVHKNELLNPVDKFAYLRSVLIGEAFKSVDDLSVTNNNYDLAWKTLL
ncbi:unnamed protein product [Hermetia illucens]|uniref:Uncharacterized protein n=1 Tax=Hermetia illucens TaxID=343691 RepID=A0A7R8UWD0_HERIL|nr:unnamed protein product [Hermetia illucens]